MKKNLYLKLVECKDFCVAEKKGKIYGTIRFSTYSINGWKGMNLEILSYINKKGVTVKKTLIDPENYESVDDKIDLEEVEEMFKLKPGEYYLYPKHINN